MSAKPTPAWRHAAASALVYLGVVLLMGRDGLGALATRVFSDVGDPVLVAAILAWNASHVPFTQAWWNFPAFHPLPNALAFSEHLLGLSIVATPIEWLTGNTIVTYNVTVLLSFVFCGMAMYALVYRLTRSAPAAFLAGIAYGFAPYRIAQLPHLQLLAAFWMPVSLLGLHAFLETGRRRWLAVFAGGWALQGLTNGYYLAFFSLLIGLWLLWFVVAARRWRELWMIAASAIVASVPVAFTVARYLAVHARHGFSRGVEEIRFFSADMAAGLCAPKFVTLWGWLRTGCKPEGELFPGVGIAAILVVGGMLAWRATPKAAPLIAPNARRIMRGVLLAAAGFYVAVGLAVWWSGGFRWQVGPLRVSSLHFEKPFAIALLCLLAAGASSDRFLAAVRRASPLAFYSTAALVMWLLTLGPAPTLMGTRVLHWAPYGLLMNLPGMAGLRVPSRFWMMVVFCLAVTVGLLIAAAVQNRTRRAARVVVVVAALVLFADGWSRWPLDDAPTMPPASGQLAGSVVLELPLGDPARDVAAAYHAVEGNWRAVNGYAGFEPFYYGVLRNASRDEEDATLRVIRATTDLSVIVLKESPRLTEMLARQPGARVIAESADRIVYRLPHAPDAPLGPPLSLRHIDATCRPESISLVADGHLDTRWGCGMQKEDTHQITLDLGDEVSVGAVVMRLGPYENDFPRNLLVTTSRDSTSWEEAYRADVMNQMVGAAMEDPAAMPLTIRFAPRLARYVRLERLDRDLFAQWSIAEISVHSIKNQKSTIKNGFTPSSPAPSAARGRRSAPAVSRN